MNSAVPVSGLHIRHIAGNRARPVLVFLHEGLGCDTLWQGFPDTLCHALGYPGLVYDRRGHGQSAALSDPRTVHYLHYAALMELPAVLEHSIPSQPYVLVGHSDGGSIALIHAAEQPQLLRGLITEAAHVFVEPETLAGIQQAAQAYAQGKLAKLTHYHDDNTDPLFQAWATTWLAPGFARWNIEYLLPAIQVPALICQGKQDQYATETQVTKIVQGIKGSATPLLVDDCRHTPHLEQPEVILRAMTAFIDSLP